MSCDMWIRMGMNVHGFGLHGLDLESVKRVLCFSLLLAMKVPNARVRFVKVWQESNPEPEEGCALFGGKLALFENVVPHVAITSS